MAKIPKNIKKYFFYFVFFSVPVFIYFRTIFFDLTYLDDNVWLIDKHWVYQQPQSLLGFFLKPDIISELFYRPLIAASFWLNSLFNASMPVSCHVLNIFLHVLNTGFVFILFLLMEYKNSVSRILTLLFAVHPVLVSAVAWIPGRTESLLALFVLLSLINFIMYTRTGKNAWLAGHLLFWICSLLTKETAVAVPLICAAYMFWVGPVKFRVKRFAVPILCWGFTGAVWWLIRMDILKSATDIAPGLVVSSLSGNIASFISYFGKVFLPVNLSVLPVPQDLPLIYGLIALFLMILLLIFSKSRRWRFILFGSSWYILFILPSLVGSFIDHEYRLYLPIIGLLIILAETGLIKRGLTSKWKSVIYIIAALLAVQSFVHSGNYKDRITFWKNAVKNSPHSPLAHRNLGAMMYLDGDLKTAESEFKKALEIDNNEKMVHNNIGLIYMRRGKFDEAIKEFKTEIKINPSFEHAYYNLGLVYWQQNQYNQAVEMWIKTLKLNPHHPDALKNLNSYRALKNTKK